MGFAFGGSSIKKDKTIKKIVNKKEKEKENKRLGLKKGKTYTKAQLMAKERIAAKKAGTYKKPKTAQELAKARIKAKKEGTYKKPKTAQELAKDRLKIKSDKNKPKRKSRYNNPRKR
mgnify:CR=1 FL=1